MRANKSIFFLALACCFVVSAPTYSVADPVLDNGHPNVSEWNLFYDYRDYGVGSSTVDGAEMRSGAYFQVSVGVSLGGLLVDYNKVVSVTATHQETGFELNLVPDDPCTSYLGLNEKYWQLFLRPYPWMLTGTWQLTLIYKGSDRQRHQQIILNSMGPTAAPVKPTYIQVSNVGSDFMVSWSGIGNSCPLATAVRYRIRVFDENSCGEKEFRASCDICRSTYPACDATSGSYDAASNRVIFLIPTQYEGRLLRLENYIVDANQVSRASQYIRLP